MLAQLFTTRLLLDGTILNFIIGVILYASLYWDAMLWVDDYPPSIRERVGALPDEKRGQRVVVAILFLGTLIVGIVLSTVWLWQENGGQLDFLPAFFHALSLLLFFGLFDTVVLDWLIFVTIQPAFIVLPGTEGMPAYNDYWFHLKGWLFNPKVWLIEGVAAVGIAGISLAIIYFM